MSAVPENANEGCVGPESQMAGKASSCAGCPNQAKCASGKGAEPDPAAEKVKEAFEGVKHTILVLSGKGGVGKSTIASQIAWGLADAKKEVGVLDIDICGPSMPRMMGVENEEVHKSGSGWSPVMAEDNLSVMSVGFMLQNKTDAIIWRGPRKTGLIKQFLTDVDWGAIDYLVVDAPPGTSDEHISIAKLLKKVKIDGAVIVTTPQEVALLDVRKEISFCRKTKIPILGVVENMSSFSCPNCGFKTSIFPPISGGARQMCKEMGVQYLGSVPMDSKLLEACEKGVSFLSTYPGAPAAKYLKRLVKGLIDMSSGSLEKGEQVMEIEDTDVKQKQHAAASQTPKDLLKSLSAQARDLCKIEKGVLASKELQSSVKKVTESLQRAIELLKSAAAAATSSMSED